MNKIRINITVDPQVKKNASKILNSLGLDLSSAINLYLKQIIIHNGLPFALSNSKDKKYSYEFVKAIIEGKIGAGNQKLVQRKKPSKEMLESLEEYQEYLKDREKYKTYSCFEEILNEETSKK